MFVVRLRNYLHLSFLVIFLLFSSCVDEFYKDTPKEGYITITGINTRAYTGAYPGDGLDDKVETLRILAFNKTSRICGIRLKRVNMILSFWPMNLIIQL